MTGSPVGRRHKEVPRAFAPRGDAEGRMPAVEGSTQDAVRREGIPPSHGVMGRTRVDVREPRKAPPRQQYRRTRIEEPDRRKAVF